MLQHLSDEQRETLKLHQGYRQRGDECTELASQCFNTGDLDNWRYWRDRAEAWHKKANALLPALHPDLEPPACGS